MRMKNNIFFIFVFLMISLWCSTSMGGPGHKLQWSLENQERLDQFLKTQESGVAVFDADGTLWTEDVGEAFFRWLIAEKKLVNPDVTALGWKKIYTHYEHLKAIDTETAYVFVVTAMAGLKEKDIQKWAADFFKKKFVPRIFLPQKDLIAKMQAKKMDVWIVSASNRWIIQAGAPYVGVDPSHVLGINLVVKEGILTKEVIKPVTYRQGKVEAIQAYINIQPDYVVGDSQGDTEMLIYAKTLRMFIKNKENQPVLLLPHVPSKAYLTQYFPLFCSYTNCPVTYY